MSPTCKRLQRQSQLQHGWEEAQLKCLHSSALPTAVKLESNCTSAALKAFEVVQLNMEVGESLCYTAAGSLPKGMEELQLSADIS